MRNLFTQLLKNTKKEQAVGCCNNATKMLGEKRTKQRGGSAERVWKLGGASIKHPLSIRSASVEHPMQSGGNKVKTMLRYAATWLFGVTKTYKTPQSATSSIELTSAYTTRQTTSELASAGMSMPSPHVEVVANRGNKPKKVESREMRVEIREMRVERLGATWLRYAACMLLLLCLGVGNVWGADFSSSEIATNPTGGTKKNNVTCSSGITTTTNKKIKNVSSQACVAIANNTDTATVTVNDWIQIQADANYTIDNSLYIVASSNGSSDGTMVVCMWRGAFSATSADTCFTAVAPENDSGTRDTIALRFPSGRFRTIRLYKRINYKNGTIGPTAPPCKDPLSPHVRAASRHCRSLRQPCRRPAKQGISSQKGASPCLECQSGKGRTPSAAPRRCPAFR